MQPFRNMKARASVLDLSEASLHRTMSPLQGLGRTGGLDEEHALEGEPHRQGEVGDFAESAAAALACSQPTGDESGFNDQRCRRLELITVVA